MRISPQPRSSSDASSMKIAPSAGPAKVRRPPMMTMMMMVAISLNFIGVGESSPM